MDDCNEDVSFQWTGRIARIVRDVDFNRCETPRRLAWFRYQLASLSAERGANSFASATSGMTGASLPLVAVRLAVNGKRTGAARFPLAAPRVLAFGSRGTAQPPSRRSAHVQPPRAGGAAPAQVTPGYAAFSTFSRSRGLSGSLSNHVMLPLRCTVCFWPDSW